MIRHLERWGMSESVCHPGISRSLRNIRGLFCKWQDNYQGQIGPGYFAKNAKFRDDRHIT